MAAISLSAACSPACPPQIWAATAPAIKSDDFNSTHKLNISLPSKFRRKNSTIKCDGLNSTYKTGLKRITVLGMGKTNLVAKGLTKRIMLLIKINI